MSKLQPPPSASLNRLRAAAALIPIIESGIADSKLTVERASQMITFCEWAVQASPGSPEETKLAAIVVTGVQRLKTELSSRPE